MSGKLKVTILGCGTSGGVPRLGGPGGHGLWGACDPENPKNRRRRVSILVESATTSLVVDTSPDFREQALAAGIARLDAVLYTHDHADHTHGIDDLRGLAHDMGAKIDIHADAATLATLTNRFGYIFKQRAGYPSFCVGHPVDGPFKVGDIPVVPVMQIHGAGRSLGYRFGALAYSTDLSDLPAGSIAALKGLDLWIVDALRREPHPTHLHLDKTLELIARVRPRRALLTHMTWDMDYQTLRRELPEGVAPAHDGLVIELGHDGLVIEFE